MAPNKFEKHIKKQLEEREIGPSANAWNRISEQLEIVEEPKPKKLFRYGVAAGFIGFLMVSIWYFNDDEPFTETQTVVTEKPVIPIEKAKTPKGILKEEIQGEQIVAKEEIKPQKTITSTSTRIVTNTVKSFIIDNDESEKYIEKVNITSKVSDELIDTKIAEIIAKVDLLEKENNNIVTDAEIDVLLRRAEQEILGNKIFIENDSVDAMALLADVENELDKSFRDQIFDALKNGFVKVRTAVADRNK